MIPLKSSTKSLESVVNKTFNPISKKVDIISEEIDTTNVQNTCMTFCDSDTTKEIVFIRKQFKDFEVVDYDNNYIYLRKPNVGVVIVSILRGSFGDYEYKFAVEKFGERTKLFRGKNAILRVKKYLKIDIS